MGVVPALLALISRSAGKMLNAVFGWAVRALFGHASETERTLLSGLVAAAAAWPLLLVGLVAPKVAALVLAFVPIPHWVPAWTIRLVWAVLALIVPCAIGVAVAMRGPPRLRQRPLWRRVLTGFPITLGLAFAFVIMFVTVPILRLVALLKSERAVEVPLITDSEAYHDTAALCVRTLNTHGFTLQPAAPSWWTQVPLRVLRFCSHDAFASFVPEHLESYAGDGLRLAFYPSGASLRGKGAKLGWAHGLIAEATAKVHGFQTSSPAAQHVEAEIHRLWSLLEEQPEAHVRSPRLIALAREIADRLATIDVGYDDWQTLYRQLMQLERGLHGQPQLLERRSDDGAQAATNQSDGHSRPSNGHNRETEDARAPRVLRQEVTVPNHEDPKNRLRIPPPPLTAKGRGLESPPLPAPSFGATPSAASSTRSAAIARTAPATAAAAAAAALPQTAVEIPKTEEHPIAVEQLSTIDLIKHITTEVSHLVGKEIELAKTELKADLKAEAFMVGGLSVAAAGGLCTLNLLLVTVVLALSTMLPGWIAGLIISGATLLITAAIAWLAWSKRVRSPMARTQRTLKDDVQWTRERLV